jgi:hypothetical protein
MIPKAKKQNGHPLNSSLRLRFILTLFAAISAVEIAAWWLLRP